MQFLVTSCSLVFWQFLCNCLVLILEVGYIMLVSCTPTQSSEPMKTGLPSPDFQGHIGLNWLQLLHCTILLLTVGLEWNLCWTLSGAGHLHTLTLSLLDWGTVFWKYLLCMTAFWCHFCVMQGVHWERWSLGNDLHVPVHFYIESLNYMK